MRHEIISELDFIYTLDNISSSGGISVVQHRAEWEFIRHPCQLLQYHEPAGNIRYDLNGTPHKPTTKMILKAFEYLTLVMIPVGDQMIVKLTDLKPIQRKILDLLDIEHNSYLKLGQIVFLSDNLSET